MWGKHEGRKMQDLWLQLRRTSGENTVGAYGAFLCLQVGQGWLVWEENIAWLLTYTEALTHALYEWGF